MLFFENVKMALLAIRINKMRSFLTMLGIIIGISAVISIVSIGDSMRGVIADQFESIGVNRAMMYVSFVEDRRESDLFTLDEMEKVREVFPKEIVAIDPGSSEDAELTRGRKTLQVTLEGVPGNYSEVQPVDLVDGRMINEADVASGRNYVVLKKETAMELFGKAEAAGETIRAEVAGEPEELLVVGVYEKEATPLDALFMGTSPVAYVPYTSQVHPGDYFFALNFYIADDTDPELFKSQIVGLISRMKNRTPDQISYNSAQEEMTMADNIMQGMSLAVGAIAAISLLVGGIGIMNIMLVSVTERTREIGIRKALGARTRDIMVQFLTESALLSAAGGVIGTLLGIGFVMIGGAIAKIDVVIDPMVVMIAVAFSAVVGVLFGILPASKAAKADPIEALRYE
jgi:putative ABC transport system permease protein